jgi:hypothetical protein
MPLRIRFYDALPCLFLVLPTRAAAQLLNRVTLDCRIRPITVMGHQYTHARPYGAVPAEIIFPS